MRKVWGWVALIAVAAIIVNVLVHERIQDDRELSRIEAEQGVIRDKWYAACQKVFSAAQCHIIAYKNESLWEKD